MTTDSHDHGDAVDEITRRLQEVHDRIDQARTPEQTVRLVAVTKRFPASVVRSAMAAGCVDFGENYAQELQTKAAEIASFSELQQQSAELQQGSVQPRWHMIGPVQRNKVKRIAGVVHLWHSVDRLSLVEEIAKRAPGSALLLQVNFTGEDTKSGADPGGVAALADAAASLNLQVKGLMAMGPTDTSIDPRPTFARCRAMVDELGLVECSTGMSGDFERAIEEGSTMVRIGSAIFGQRPV